MDSFEQNIDLLLTVIKITNKNKEIPHLWYDQIAFKINFKLKFYFLLKYYFTKISKSH